MALPYIHQNGCILGSIQNKTSTEIFFYGSWFACSIKNIKKKTRMMGILIKYLCHYLPRHG